MNGNSKLEGGKHLDNLGYSCCCFSLLCGPAVEECTTPSGDGSTWTPLLVQRLLGQVELLPLASQFEAFELSHCSLRA